MEITWDQSCNEWVAFEFQGVIESKGKIDGAEIGTFQLKDVCFSFCVILNASIDDSQGKPVVIIGNNEVRGEVVTLKTPLCVIKKKEDRDKMEEDETYAGTSLYSLYPRMRITVNSALIIVIILLFITSLIIPFYYLFASSLLRDSSLS